MALLKPRPKSAARDKLDGAIKARAAVAAKMAALTASIARLGQQIEAVGPAQDALARFDSAQSARLATWAQGAEAHVPQADWQERERLERELSAARATAASAAAAKAGLEAQYTAKANELPPIEMWTRATIAEIVADEIPPLAEAARRIGAELIAAQQRLIQAVDLTKGIFQSLPPGEAAAAANVAMTKVAKAMSAAHEKPPLDPDKTAASRQAWAAFAADLREDAFVFPAEAQQ
jgi:hypothetical protein